MEIAQIFQETLSGYLSKFADQIPSNHLKAINAIINCRTRKMGGDVFYCKNCRNYHYSYHSCKNRHCPKCGSDDSDKWLEKQISKLLPVDYFMVTFTIPSELRFVCRSNQKLFYSIMFKAASDALKTLLNDPKYAGGKSGFVGILHTWTRLLLYHPHIHFIVPGGAFDFERNQWNKTNSKFLVPVRALSQIFRAKFRDLLKEQNPEIFNLISSDLWRTKEFITHSQTVGKGKKALKYLANYVYRVAISNNRIVSCQNGEVTFKYKPSGSDFYELKTVSTMEFMRRFLLHILPDRFQKIRYYGFLSSASKKDFATICEFFEIKSENINPAQESEFDKRERDICPHCKSKMVHFTSLLSPFRKTRAPPKYLLESLVRKENKHQQTF